MGFTDEFKQEFKETLSLAPAIVGGIFAYIGVTMDGSMAVRGAFVGIGVILLGIYGYQSIQDNE